jgi:hypothetical protein
VGGRRYKTDADKINAAIGVRWRERLPASGFSAAPVSPTRDPWHNGYFADRVSWQSFDFQALIHPTKKICRMHYYRISLRLAEEDVS